MSRSSDDMTRVEILLRSAALFLPEGSVRTEVEFLARRCSEILKNVADVEAGRLYKCTCCGVEAQMPLGFLDPNKCGPCFNGVCEHKLVG